MSDTKEYFFNEIIELYKNELNTSLKFSFKRIENKTIIREYEVYKENDVIYIANKISNKTLYYIDECYYLDKYSKKYRSEIMAMSDIYHNENLITQEEYQNWTDLWTDWDGFRYVAGYAKLIMEECEGGK